MPPDRTSLRAAETSAGEGLTGLGNSLKPVVALAALDATDIVGDVKVRYDKKGLLLVGEMAMVVVVMVMGAGGKKGNPKCELPGGHCQALFVRKDPVGLAVLATSVYHVERGLPQDHVPPSGTRLADAAAKHKQTNPDRFDCRVCRCGFGVGDPRFFWVAHSIWRCNINTFFSAHGAQAKRAFFVLSVVSVSPPPLNTQRAEC